MTTTTKYDLRGNSYYSVMFREYLDTALSLGSDCDEDGSDISFDGLYDLDDYAECSLEEAWNECVAFADETESIRGSISARDLGYNFFLNRNGHGAGFWDRDYSGIDGCDDDTGEKLSDACKPWGTHDVYTGDDGKVYFHG